jgi:hypothetical protein
MKWKTNRPEYGAQRVVCRFALLPVKLSNGFTVWLERYYELQEQRGVSSNFWIVLKRYQPPESRADFEP